MFTSADTHACTVSGTTVTGVAEGATDCVIHANAAAVGGYGAATQVSQVIAVGPAPCGVVGQAGPGGGVIFLNDRAGVSGLCFEAAPANWDGVNNPDPDLAWGTGEGTAGTCSNLDITGAGATAIGAGAANTTAITSNAACDTPEEAPAAWAAKNSCWRNADGLVLALERRT